MKFSEFSQYFQIFFSVVVILIISFYSIYLWSKNFKVINKKLFFIIFSVFRYFSCFSIIIIILFVSFAKVISNKQQEIFVDYLINPKNFAYRQRILDKNDTMPKIKYVESVDEIKEILFNRDFIEDLLRGLTQNNYPCVYSYHVISDKGNTPLVNETLPHFMVLNKKFDVFNDFTKNTNPFLKFLNIEESFISKYIINKFGINELQGPFLFIFNANITGGSMFASEEILKHSTLYNWNNDPDFLNRRLTIQINCVNVYWYKNKMVIEEAILTFTGKLAYCIQDFLLDVQKFNQNKLI